MDIRFKPKQYTHLFLHGRLSFKAKPIFVYTGGTLNAADERCMKLRTVMCERSPKMEEVVDVGMLYNKHCCF